MHGLQKTDGAPPKRRKGRPPKSPVDPRFVELRDSIDRALENRVALWKAGGEYAGFAKYIPTAQRDLELFRKQRRAHERRGDSLEWVYDWAPLQAKECPEKWPGEAIRGTYTQVVGSLYHGPIDEDGAIRKGTHGRKDANIVNYVRKAVDATKEAIRCRWTFTNRVIRPLNGDSIAQEKSFAVALSRISSAYSCKFPGKQTGILADSLKQSEQVRVRFEALLEQIGDAGGQFEEIVSGGVRDKSGAVARGIVAEFLDESESTLRKWLEYRANPLLKGTDRFSTNRVT